MIMNNRKIFYDKSAWEVFQVKFKLTLYKFMNELLQIQLCTPLIYKLLILIETMQFIWYALHERFNFLWNTIWLSYLRATIKYFQFDSLLQRGNQNFIITIMYLIFSLLVIMIIITLYSIYRILKNKKKPTLISSFCLKLLSTFGLLLTTILVMPFYEVFMSIIYCNNNNPINKEMTCYEQYHILHMIIAICGLIVLIIYTIIYNLLYVDLNPNSNIPFAAPQNNLSLMKTGIKILLPLYIILDYSGSLQKQFIAFYGIGWAILLFLRYKASPYFNRSVNTFVLICEAIVFWTCGVSNIHAFIDFGDVDNIGLFFLIIGAPIISFSYVCILEGKKWYLISRDIKFIKDQNDLELYAMTLLYFIDKRSQPPYKIQLEGMLKIHMKYCQKKEDDCPCLYLVKDYLKDDENHGRIMLWYDLVKTIIMESLEKFPKTPKLHLLHAFIQHQRLQNKFKAASELMMAEENKPNMQIEFAIFRYKNQIEEEMVENDIRSFEKKAIDVNVIVHFQNKFQVFIRSIEKSVNLHLDFWKEFLEESPDIQKLQSLGSKITKNVEKTIDKFKKLSEINPNHIKCLTIYGNFLKDIANDETEAQKILEKAEYIDKSSMVNKQFIDNERLKYGENSNTCIVTTSGNFNSLGIVTDVNNEITRILNFSKREVIDQNINKIMPKAYSDIHDRLMKKFLESSIPRMIGKERFILPINKDGYIVPCTLMVKVLPNLDEGIRIVGFLKDIENTTSYLKGDFECDEKAHYIMYDEKRIIQGITYSCCLSFGIHSNLVVGNNFGSNELTLDAIFPELFTNNLDELKSPSGLILKLDTSNLGQNFPLHNESDQGNSCRTRYDNDDYHDNKNDEGMSNRYKCVKIRAILAQEDEFPEKIIKILKFVELNEKDGYGLNLQRDENFQSSNDKDQANNIEDNVEEEKDKKEENDDGEKDDQLSNRSNSSLNDDLMQLKDFKILISERTVPKWIRILRITIFVILGIFITLLSIKLSLHFTQANEISQGISAISNIYQRQDYLANINFNARCLYLEAMNMINLTMIGFTSAGYELYIKNNLLELIDVLQNIEFKAIKDNLDIIALDGNSADSEIYAFTQLFQNNQTNNYTNIYNNGLFQYITAASSIRNSSLESFNSTTDIESTIKNFYFIIQNGLNSLRYGSEYIAQAFYDFYYQRTFQWENNFKLIMILGIVFICLSQCVLLPIVFTVYKTNKQVLSLFGYISEAEIAKLANKCERFLNNYIDDKQEKQEIADDNKNEEHDNLLQSPFNTNKPNQTIQPEDDLYNNSPTTLHQQHHNNHPFASPEKLHLKTKDPHESPYFKQTSINPFQISSPLSSSTWKNIQSGMKPTMQSPSFISNNSKNRKMSSNDSPKSPKKQTSSMNREKERMKEMEKSNENVEFERTQKLLNAKAINRGGIISQFSFFSLLFIAFFVTQYILESFFLEDVRLAYQHLQFISQRSPYLRYVSLFTLEEIVQSIELTYQDMKGEDSIRYYIDRIYINEGLISETIKNPFPSDFNGYILAFLDYNLDDVCLYAYANDLSALTVCQSINSGIITKGLQTSSIFAIEQSKDVINTYRNTQMQHSDQYNSLNNINYNSSVQIIKYITPPLTTLNIYYINAFNSYLNTSLSIANLIFALFVILIAIVYICIWLPYQANINERIWRTKGMLSMIPMEVIKKNENLKNLLVSGDLLRSVK